MSGSGAGGGRFGWMRAVADRTPARWIAAGVAAVLFAVTAAFGGLATAASSDLAEIEPGTEHRSEQVAIRITQATLHDADESRGIRIEDDQQMLILTMTLENLHVRPVHAGILGDIADAFTVAELEGLEDDLIDSHSERVDDGTLSPVLQPNVPVDTEFRYTVEAGRFADGDMLHVTLNDLTLHIGQFVTSGEWFADPVPAARMELPVRYVEPAPTEEDAP